MRDKWQASVDGMVVSHEPTTDILQVFGVVNYLKEHLWLKGYICPNNYSTPPHYPSLEGLHFCTTHDSYGFDSTTVTYGDTVTVNWAKPDKSKRFKNSSPDLGNVWRKLVDWVVVSPGHNGYPGDSCWHLNVYIYMNICYLFIYYIPWKNDSPT